MRFVIAVLTIALMPIACLAQSAEIDHVDIVAYGIYTADETGTGVNTAIGASRLLGNIRHAATTTTVPAQLGVKFGFEYVIVGSPANGQATLTKVTIFPRAGLRVPGSGPVYRTDYPLTRTIGSVQYTGYQFDNPWELVPGVWTLELWSGDRKLASKRFTVVRR